MVDHSGESCVHAIGNAAELNRHETRKLGDVVCTCDTSVKPARLNDSGSNGSAIDIGQNVVVGQYGITTSTYVATETTKSPSGHICNRRNARPDPDRIRDGLSPQRSLSPNVDDLRLAMRDVPDLVDDSTVHLQMVLHEDGELGIVFRRVSVSNSKRNIFDVALL